ncbi:MAG: glycosyltransferase, partial [Actinomycetota bacterium]|nr:glycosyltransferase [Actinomycetota bacterium]
MTPLSRPAVSVVVPTRDRPGFLRSCLAAITPLLGPGDELVVVDSASADRAAVAAEVTPPAVLVRVERPGASRARNAGW